MILKRYNYVSLVHKRLRHWRNKTANFPDKKSELNCLCKYLNISENKAQYLTMKHPVVTKLSEEKIKDLLNTINEIGFSKEELVNQPGLFGILPITLKFRFKVLLECGLEPISPEHIATYLTIIRQKSIGDLKKSYEIPAHINVENRLASYMTQWPTSLTTLVYEDINKSTLYTLRLKIIQRYLELVLDLTKEEFYRGIETYPTVKHRPLEYINETLKILQSQFAIPNQKIKSNLYLIHADPENLKNLIYNLRNIGGIDIKEVIRMHPKIALKSCQTLLEIQKILEEYGISKEAQRRCFDIYTLGPDTIRERLEKAKSIPEFSVLFYHPRFLKMIHYNKTAMLRLSKSYEKNKKCISLNILSGSSAHYKTFEKAHGDRLGKGKDLLFCISQSFGKKINMTHVKNVIRRHPFWINTPVLQVKYLYEQLSLRFTNEDIYENCSILLYPWKKVRDVLYLLNKRQLHEHFPIFHENFNFDALSNSQKLSLTLYVLEKNHYFSGNGVWSEERNRIDKIQSHELENCNG